MKYSSNLGFRLHRLRRCTVTLRLRPPLLIVLTLSFFVFSCAEMAMMAMAGSGGGVPLEASPIPVYGRPTNRRWTIQLGREPSVIVEAVQRLAADTGLSMTRPGGETAIRLTRGKVTANELNRKRLRSSAYWRALWILLIMDASIGRSPAGVSL